jgi:hypothetical protein
MAVRHRHQERHREGDQNGRFGLRKITARVRQLIEQAL